MWETLATALLRFVEEFGDLSLFLIILVEESGVPMPLPGDLVLIWAGSRIAAGKSNPFVVLGLVEFATVIGASVLYWLAVRGGRPLIVRYGRFLHLDEAKLSRAEHWMARNAMQAVVLGRIIPGLRIATPLAAGVFRVPYRQFLAGLSLGAFTYAAFWVCLGYYFGPSVIALLHAPRLTGRLIVSLVFLAALGLLTWRIRQRVLPSRRDAAFHISRRRHLEAAVLAGLLATIEMTLVGGALLAALTEFGFDTPERTLLRVAAFVATGHGSWLRFAFLPLAAVSFVLAGVLWAVLYALVIEPRLRAPDWAKGALFALLPTVASWLIVLPLLGAGLFGLGLDLGRAPALLELARHLVYGIALGLSYPMLLLARLPWHAHTTFPPRERGGA